MGQCFSGCVEEEENVGADDESVVEFANRVGLNPVEVMSVATAIENGEVRAIAVVMEVL